MDYAILFYMIMKDKLQQIDLENPEFQNAWKLISYTKQSVFLTGKAGSGKSTFLKYIRDNTRKKYVVLAPTGIAAVNVGGVTLHSFFRIPLKPLLPDDPDFAVSRLRSRLRYPKDLQKIIKQLDLIIIDEISMVRADIIDFIDKVLRVYGGNMREPFGGKQLLLVGDIFQLEPVVTADMRDLLRKYYPNSYFFSAQVFKELEIVPIELKKIYRQSDEMFISMLDRIRLGHVLDSDIKMLNSKVVSGGDDDKNGHAMVMTLATRRDMVDAINEEHLNRLKSREVEYLGTIKGDFPENSLPTAIELVLKVGAQIVFIKNDRDRRWVNGTIGKVVKATDDVLEIELETGEKHIVEPAIWENIEYKYDEESKRVIEKQIGSFIQFPVKLAWALTVHKSQGLTFSNVMIDMGQGAFSSGQTYVALSRCRSLEGIKMKSTINARDVFINPAIIAFSRTFNDIMLINDAMQHAQADDCYHRAAKAFDAGDMTLAVELFIKAVQTRSELNRESAARLLRRKLSVIPKLQEQVNIYKEIVAGNESRFRELASEYVLMGDECLSEAMDYAPAIANYDRALSLDAQCLPAWYGKALALMEVRCFDEAEECLKKVLSIDTAHFNAAFQLGNLYKAKGDLHNSLNWYLVAIDNNPKDAMAHDCVADIYDLIGEETMADEYRQIAGHLRKTRRRKNK